MVLPPLAATGKQKLRKGMAGLIDFLDPAIQPAMRDFLGSEEQILAMANSLAKLIEQKIGKITRVPSGAS